LGKSDLRDAEGSSISRENSQPALNRPAGFSNSSHLGKFDLRDAEGSSTTGGNSLKTGSWRQTKDDHRSLTETIMEAKETKGVAE
jgi:hypothetical protein